MPEGHTLRRLALDLDAAFAGDRVAVSSPQGRFAAEAAQLDGAVLVGAESAGKHLFVAFEGERLVHVHLGLIGRFDVADGPAPAPQGAVRLRLVGPRAHADLRGATRCDLVTPERRDAVVASLGADPLRADADPDRAWATISRSRRSIGELLMDQAVVAGVGNVYRAEVLFRQRVDPFRPGTSLRRAQWQAIWDDLVALMPEGVVANRIDTVRPEHAPEAMGREPRADDHGGEVYVYRRAGQPCLLCGTTVRTEPMASRNLFWCPRCQRRWRPRPVR
ncbi:Fpg/Nei family DNA glycosylase [Nocardioides sp. TRM66260-LWL]|uniref:Fpg/Nei family DNA glycosylase n=1 Tax=Nocardioides sp. TRM66260-LWL TaxID=2874478 RepID=UPI001CC5D261|nr:DNA-formamidopyrimidine glycosylase family protein [Nocardioides sp. TRM66260-LWL]MBZ5733023.1 Fpg/Nei family DNA glycosylase [Nocardioides sp. TRM66260-LWL]